MAGAWGRRLEPIDVQLLSGMAALQEDIVPFPRSFRDQLLYGPVAPVLFPGDLVPLGGGDGLFQVHQVTPVAVDPSRTGSTGNDQDPSVPVPVVQPGHPGSFPPGIGRVDQDLPTLDSERDSMGRTGPQAESPVPQGAALQPQGKERTAGFPRAQQLQAQEERPRLQPGNGLPATRIARVQVGPKAMKVREVPVLEAVDFRVGPPDCEGTAGRWPSHSVGAPTKSWNCFPRRRPEHIWQPTPAKTAAAARKDLRPQIAMESSFCGWSICLLYLA